MTALGLCLHCRATVNIAGAFCPTCGQAFPALSYCHGCGERLGKGVAFCPACGTNQAQDPLPARPRHPLRHLRTVVAFYATIVAGVHLLGLRGETASASIAWSQGFLAVMVMVALAVGYQPPAPPRPGIDRQAWVYGLLLFVGLVLLNVVYHATVIRVFNMPVATFDIPFMWHGLLLVCVMPAIFEELCFRRIVQVQLETLLGKQQALWLAAMLFAIGHSTILSWPYLMICGLFLGFIYQQTGRLWICMLFHFLHNLIVSLLPL